MVCRPLVTKLLSKPILAFRKLDHCEQISVTFWLDTDICENAFEKVVCKIGSRIVSALICPWYYGSHMNKTRILPSSLQIPCDPNDISPSAYFETQNVTRIMQAVCGFVVVLYRPVLLTRFNTFQLHQGNHPIGPVPVKPSGRIWIIYRWSIEIWKCNYNKANTKQIRPRVLWDILHL